jgi:putative peptidoglycan lipid II flippase
MAISTAVFPTLATQAAREERRQLGETLARSLRLILFLSLPAGVGMMVLGKPLVVLLLQRGAFGAASADLTAQALLLYAAGLFAHSGIEILSRGFYALGDTRTPVLFAVLSMLLNLALCAALVGVLELRGLALALSIAATAEFAGLYVVLGRRIPELASTAVRRSVLQSLGALAALTVVCLAVLVAVDSGLGLSASRPAGAALALAAGAVAGGAAYAGVAVLLGSEELRPLLAPLAGVASRGRGKGAVGGGP